MNAYKVMVASLVFFALFTGASNFQQSFYSGQGVESNSTGEIQAEYDKLGDRIDNLRSSVRSVSSPETSVLDSVVAGLYLVPDFLSVILSPITILNTTIDAVAARYVFIPGFAATGLKTVIVAGVSWSAFRLLIGLRG